LKGLDYFLSWKQEVMFTAHLSLFLIKGNKIKNKEQSKVRAGLHVQDKEHMHHLKKNYAGSEKITPPY